MKQRKSARRGFDRAGAGETGPERIFGIHAAEAALRNPARHILSVRATANAAGRLAGTLAARGVRAEEIKPDALSRLLGPDTVHQGVLIEAGPLPAPELEELLADASSAGPFVVLDQVTDPHNVGAILRSAAVFGVAGVITTRRNSPPGGGALAKAASGAAEYVPLVRVANLARALAQLGDRGILRIGLDSDAAGALEDLPAQERAAIVLGAEHRGLRRLTREHCDTICRITTAGPLASLNVSNAAAVALHTLTIGRKR